MERTMAILPGRALALAAGPAGAADCAKAGTERRTAELELKKTLACAKVGSPC